jgi:alpha-L-rhamnosidase
MVRRACLVLFFVSILPYLTAAQSTPASDSQGDSLYTEFQNPPREYSPMPFWFWNGKLEGAKVQEQVRRMVEQHVYGAFLHGRDGLQTPYLSEEWFSAVGAGLEEAKRSGFQFNFVDEYNWPSGEVRNIWMAGNHQSEVLARRPDLRMKSIAYKEQIVHGPQSVTMPEVSQLQAVLVARWFGGGRIDRQSLHSLDLPIAATPVQWTAPAGDWLIMEFYLEPSMGFDGGFVDLMNPEATKLYFDLSYGEYYRRFRSYFGGTIRYSFSDHEGVFGYRIAWTPTLYEAFQRRAGYDLRTVLPLLIYDGGDDSAKVRQDYLGTVTQLYEDSYWTGITDKAKQLGIGRSGHAWEENLQSGAAFQGSLFALERGLNPVGVDSLGDFGRQPLNFKVAQSVADFEGRRFACENQGVQGTDSYLDMQGLRKATNSIGAWGVNLFIPHAFDYDVLRANYPPDWLHQPYWPHFSAYADYTRRISFMNAEDSHHATNILLYYPITTMWADSAPLFNNKSDYQSLIDPPNWKNRSVMVNDYYTRLILRLSERQWDYNIADDYYLERAHVEGKELVIGPQNFQAVVLPPISTLSSKSLKKLQEFYLAGGTILGIRMLPGANGESDNDSKSLQSGVDQIFGTGAASTPNPFIEAHNSTGGHAFYVSESVETLIDLLDANIPKDAKVISGTPNHLFLEHRKKSTLDYYWLVNDTARPRANRIRFSVSGVPEKWDALTGRHSPLFYVNRPKGTEVWLDFDAWDAYFVVFHPLQEHPQGIDLLATNAQTVKLVSQNASSIVVQASALADQKNIEVAMGSAGRTFRGQSPIISADSIPLNGTWKFRPESAQVSVPFAQIKDAAKMEGEQLGFAQTDFDDSIWSSLWLSEAQNTIRNWNVIGPFPNQDDSGFQTVFPPETKYDPQAHYDGVNGSVVRWERYYGDEPYLSKALIIMETSGGHFDDDSAAVDLNRVFRLGDDSWKVGYALTYLYSPIDQSATFVVAADNWEKVWLNHKEIFGQLRHPFWFELNDNWADRVSVALHKGWNEVLVKVGMGRSGATGTFGFTFRVADAEGKTISAVTSSLAPDTQPQQSSANSATRWYRIQVPPGTTAFLPPALEQPYRLYFNGEELKSNGAMPVSFEKLLRPEKNILVIAAKTSDHLSSPIQFLSAPTPFVLQSWTKTGLANFSGSAIYEKTFSLPPSFQGKRVMLDLGRVSSVAEVQANGRDAGTLVWEPYRLDITQFLKPGDNHLHIRVTNTEANARAVGSWHNILPKIDLCGLEGPVQIVPYVDQTLTLKAE